MSSLYRRSKFTVLVVSLSIRKFVFCLHSCLEEMFTNYLSISGRLLKMITLLNKYNFLCRVDIIFSLHSFCFFSHLLAGFLSLSSSGDQQFYRGLSHQRVFSFVWRLKKKGFQYFSLRLYTSNIVLISIIVGEK